MKAKGVIAVASVCAISIFGGLYYYKDINKIENIDNLICKNEDGNLSCATKDLKPYTGIILIKYPDTDQIDKKIHIKNGKPDGLSKSYSKNGQLKSEFSYKDDKLEVDKAYYANGQLKSQCDYSNGDIIACKYYYKNGQLKFEQDGEELSLGTLYKSYYKNGQIKEREVRVIEDEPLCREPIYLKYSYKDQQPKSNKGIHDEYYKDGQLKREEYWDENGLLDGVVTEYYKSGSIKSKANWKHDKLNGVVLNYDEYGNVKYEANWKNGKKDGLEKMYDDEGKLVHERNYVNNKLNGVSKFYYQNGQIKSEVNYKNDYRDGIEKRYGYKNRLLEEEINWKESNKDGISRVYYKDGQIEEETNWKDDKLQSLIIYYPKNRKVKFKIDVRGEVSNANGAGGGCAYQFFPYRSKEIDGEVESTVKFYGEDGKLKVERNFNGISIDEIIHEIEEEFKIELSKSV